VAVGHRQAGGVLHVTSSAPRPPRDGCWIGDIYTDWHVQQLAESRLEAVRD
jgi:hypothetical protein